MNEFKLIVANSRDFCDYEALIHVLHDLSEIYYPDKQISIVSGMAKGADSLGVRFARENHAICHCFPANWNANGKAACFIRNREMGNYSDGLLAFWDGKSKVTEHMITYMRSLGKPVHVIDY